MTHAMGSAGLGGADTTVFNETVSRATREQRADRAENHHFRQIMTQRLGCMKARGQLGSAGAALWGDQAERPSSRAKPRPLHCRASLWCQSAQQTHPLGQELSPC